MAEKRKFRIVEYPARFSNWYRVEEYKPGTNFYPGAWVEVYNDPTFAKCKRFVDAQKHVLAKEKVVGEYEI
jgi:hypothetical protein